MGINKRYLEKYDKAYAGIPATISPIEFTPESPYYHQEEWREVLPMFIPGVLPHTYWISSWGRVYTNLRSPNYPNGGEMKPSVNGKGYYQINLKSVDGKKICVKLTRLILLHFRFVPGCQYYEVDHIDGDKSHNYLWNLEWVTPQENVKRAIRNGQRTIAASSSYLKDEDSLLTDQQATSLFFEAVNDNTGIYYDLAEKYNVSTDYVMGLINGSIRPYIKAMYTNNVMKNSASTEDKIMPNLPDEIATNIFLESIGKDDNTLNVIAEKYNVSVPYIQSLLRGIVRPYIWANYYNRANTDSVINRDANTLKFDPNATNRKNKFDTVMSWLSDRQASKIFLEAINKDDNTINMIAEEYNIPISYIYDLLRGNVRPYILAKYNNGLLK